MAFRRRQMLLLVFGALCAFVLVCAGAQAATGGATFTDYTAATTQSGGSPRDNAAADKMNRAAKRAAERRRTPVIIGFALGNRAQSAGSTPLKIRYRVKAPAKRVRVRLLVRTNGNRYIRTVDLGVHRTGVLQKTRISAARLGVGGAGTYKLRLLARDGKGRKAKRDKKVRAWLKFTFVTHRFPVDGPFSFGSTGARFGAGRDGHTHQGQDVVADSGTPLVAPYGGKVSWVDYQAGGAGYYVVLDSDDGNDYVFMHLLKGSTLVKSGQRVATGQRLGLVGATGVATGPHLHFEIWVGGPWQFGGHPIDPLPTLQSWYAAGRGNAVRTSSLSVPTHDHEDHFLD